MTLTFKYSGLLYEWWNFYIRDKKGSIKAIRILIGVVWLNSFKLFPLLVRPWIKVMSSQNSKFFLSFGLCCYRSGFQSLLIKRIFPRRLGEVVILINSCFLSFFCLSSFNHRGFIIIVWNSGSLSWPLFGASISYKIGARVEKTPAVTGPPRRRQWLIPRPSSYTIKSLLYVGYFFYSIPGTQK